jgi:hypothetical protein
MPKKVDKYINEQREIANKILNIIGINENNKILSLVKLDENIEMQNSILNLEPEIKKYFLVSKLSFINNIGREYKRRYLAIIKTIMRIMKIKMSSSILTTKFEDTNTHETFYVFNISSFLNEQTPN